MARHSAVDHSILEAALVGLEQQRSQIDAKISEIRRRLRTGGGARPEAAAAAPRAKRVLSPAARRRIAEATRKRWAAYRAQKAQATAKRSPAKKAAKKTAGASASAPAASA